MPLRHATAGSELLSVRLAFCDLVGQAVWVEMSENTWLWIRALPLPLESSLAEAVGARNLQICTNKLRFFRAGGMGKHRLGHLFLQCVSGHWAVEPM